MEAQLMLRPFVFLSGLTKSCGIVLAWWGWKGAGVCGAQRARETLLQAAPRRAAGGRRRVRWQPRYDRVRGSAVRPGTFLAFLALTLLGPWPSLALPEFAWVPASCPTRATRQQKASGQENVCSLASSRRPGTENAGPQSGRPPGRTSTGGARCACGLGQRRVPAGGCAGTPGQRGTRWRWLGSTCHRREGHAGKQGSRQRVAAGPQERRERRRREEGARRREAGRKKRARQAGGGRAD